MRQLIFVTVVLWFGVLLAQVPKASVYGTGRRSGKEASARPLLEIRAQIEGAAGGGRAVRMLGNLYFVGSER